MKALPLDSITSKERLFSIIKLPHSFKNELHWTYKNLWVTYFESNMDLYDK